MLVEVEYDYNCESVSDYILNMNTIANMTMMMLMMMTMTMTTMDDDDDDADYGVDHGLDSQT